LSLPTTGLTATTVIRLKATGDFGVTDIGLDNVRVSYVTCPAVTGVTVTGVTDTRATVSFTPVTGAASYTITATPATGTPITQSATSSPVNLTGLNANTAYTVTVVVNCGTTNGNSAPSGASFTTDCAAAPYVLVNNSTPYTQDFEATWQSQCGTNEIPAVNWRGKPVTGNNSWRREDDGASAAWGSPTSGIYTPTGSPLSGGTSAHSARFHSYNASRGTSGQLDLYVNLAGTAAAAGLSFDYINTSGSDSLAVMVSTNGGVSFGRSLTTLTTANTWTRQTLTLPATAGATTIIRFMATSDFGTTDIGLDNVRVTYSACLPVSNLTATNVTSNSAQLSFTPPAGAPTGTTYEIEYGPQGFTLGSGTKVTGLTSPTYALTGLTQAKDYCFYVRQNCGTVNGTSSYAGPVCFTTPLPTLPNDEPCGAIALGNTVTNGTNLGATTSAQNGLVLPTCSGAQLPKDVWFSFTATATTLPLTVTGTTAGVVQVYSSPSCSAGPFTRVFCQAGPGNNQNVGALTITGLTPGTRYYLSVSGYGSGDTQGSFSIGAVPTGTKAQADTDALLVYPNPSNTGQLTLRLSGQTGNGQATLLNALGQVVATKNLTGTAEQTLSTRGLATGLYTLRVTMGGQVLTRKVVLE
ncbi:fibronectin type III domain-containing protein, partial [Hymenobacter agri]